MAAIEGIRVSIYRKIGVGDDIEYAYYGADNTDVSGEFSISGLPAGTYRLKFSDSNGAYLTEYFDGAASLDTATDIVVGAAATVTGKDAVLGAAAFVEGTVTDA